MYGLGRMFHELATSMWKLVVDAGLVINPSQDENEAFLASFEKHLKNQAKYDIAKEEAEKSEQDTVWMQ